MEEKREIEYEGDQEKIWYFFVTEKEVMHFFMKNIFNVVNKLWDLDTYDGISQGVVYGYLTDAL